MKGKGQRKEEDLISVNLFIIKDTPAVFVKRSFPPGRRFSFLSFCGMIKPRMTVERRVQPMRNRMTATVVMGLALAFLLLLFGTDVSAQVEKMSKEELKSM